MHVEVIYALPETQHRVHLELEQGATVAMALNAIRRLPPFNSLDLDQVAVGVFGRLVNRAERLSPDDRLEIYRPLETDPRAARRRRAASR